MTSDLSIIIPTYNEKNNIAPLIQSLRSALEDVEWEVVFVDDDSPDGTSKLLRDYALKDNRVRVIQRLGRRGLASACIEGVLSSSSPYICIMDADLQHDEGLLNQMLDSLRNEDLDLVIGSRYTDQGNADAMPYYRKKLSEAANWFSNRMFGVNITDPMSGYFMFTRHYFESVQYKLSGRGFKILLDMLISSHQPVRFKELPYVMRQRQHGESKLDFLVIWDFLIQIINRVLGKFVPYRFLSFMTVGFSGLVIHMFFLWLLHAQYHGDFTYAQSVATFIAMTSNYFLNNIFTYHDARKKNKALWSGLFKFYLVCLLGAVLNVALASYLYDRNIIWIIAGISGAMAGAVWNFTISNIFVWTIYKKTNSQE